VFLSTRVDLGLMVPVSLSSLFHAPEPSACFLIEYALNEIAESVGFVISNTLLLLVPS
jgi:hypothetical protein